MKVYKIKRKFKNLQTRQWVQKQNMFFPLLLGHNIPLEGGGVRLANLQASKMVQIWHLSTNFYSTNIITFTVNI